jgi:hypothetical protein
MPGGTNCGQRLLRGRVGVFGGGHTGPWIFGRKVMLPAGVVERIDTEERKVYVDRTKEQIKDAPDYDEMLRNNPEYRETLGGYYSGTYERPGFGI